MPDSTPLEIMVDAAVHLPCGPLSRKVVDALRRQLRQQDLGARAVAAQAPRTAFNLLETRDGYHCLPQGLLSRVTELCQRFNIPYEINERRAMRYCPPLRSSMQLAKAEQETLRKLLLKDSGVIVAAGEQSRRTLVIELIARRQQRTLMAVPSEQAQRDWLQHIQEALSLPEPHVSTPEQLTEESWIVVAPYQHILSGPLADAQRETFGLMIYDGLSIVEPTAFIGLMHRSHSRYLLGVASGALREDGCHGPMFLSLGGVLEQPLPDTASCALRLSLVGKATAFEFPNYQGRQHYQALLAQLAADEPRSQSIAQDVRSEAEKKHPCLVLSERRDHLENLGRLLPSTLPAATITSTIKPAERSRLISRYENGELLVLLVTSQIALESITTPRTERLFLTFPFSYVRKLSKLVESLLHPFAEKKEAIVYDYDDLQIEPLHRAFEKRRAFFANLQRQGDKTRLAQAQLKLPLD